MASLFQRGKTWWITYRIDGKRVRRSLDTDNERVARDRLKYVEGLHHIGELDAPSRTDIPTFLESYCRHLLASGRPKGARTDISRLRNFFGPCCPAMHYERHTPAAFRKEATDLPMLATENGRQRIGVRSLEQITTLSIKTFLDDNLADENFGPASGNKYLEIFTRMFNYAFDVVAYRCPVRGLKHPVAKLKRYRIAAPVITFLTEPDIEQQLAAVGSDVVVHGMVATYIFAGLRREEATWLTDADVDLARRLIHVQPKTIDGEYWCPKTKVTRVVPISTRLAEILQTYKAQRPSGITWFFPSPKGGRWDPDNFSQRALAPVNAAAGLGWTTLDFRHTFGTHLAMAGRSLYVISQFMGNSPDICRKHYARLMPEALHDDVEFQHAAHRPAFRTATPATTTAAGVGLDGAIPAASTNTGAPSSSARQPMPRLRLVW